MKVLYIGGTGEISLDCVRTSVNLGHDVTVFNRGQANAGLPTEVQQITGDIRDDIAYQRLAENNFDVVCQFLVYQSEGALRDIEFFQGHCRQHIFISTASAYQKGTLPITEATPLENPYWPYSRSKADCETLLLQSELPSLIVRPSHTYRTRLPSIVIDGNHLAWRIRNNKPVIVPDDGENLWTLTHSEDFARAFCALIGRTELTGQSVHITDSNAHSWNHILKQVADVMKTQAEIVPIPTETLVTHNSDWIGPLQGDKANSLTFDNAKIQSLTNDWQCSITLQEGIGRIWPSVKQKLDGGYKPDVNLDAMIDAIINGE